MESEKWKVQQETRLKQEIMLRCTDGFRGWVTGEPAAWDPRTNPESTITFPKFWILKKFNEVSRFKNQDNRKKTKKTLVYSWLKNSGEWKVESGEWKVQQETGLKQEIMIRCTDSFRDWVTAGPAAWDPRTNPESAITFPKFWTLEKFNEVRRVKNQDNRKETKEKY